MERNVEHFLYLYFYELEAELNRLSQELQEIKFQSEEANTDEYLKKYIKTKIQGFNSIENTNLEYLQLIYNNTSTLFNVKDLFEYRIESVSIPEELTPEQKHDIMESKESVYTNPDLYLKITNDKNDFIYITVELKSTKNNIIPGSSIQQVSPYEWVIFIKRDTRDIKVATGFYINSITDKLPFPDRSPRPLIGFNTLVKWNARNRKAENSTLTILVDKESNKKKIGLLNDWQNFLAEQWLNTIKSEESKNNEKWFNNALRKFAVKFLNYTNEFSVQEREKLLSKLNSLIK